MTMMASWRLLPLDLIELQLGQIDLLLAMYPEDITIDASSQTTLDTLKSLEDESSKNSFAVAPSVSTLLQVIVPLDTTPNQHTLELDLTFPFFHDGEGDKQPEDPPQVKVRICQPFWLSRAATAQLMTDLPEEEDLLGTIEHIKDAAEEQLKQAVEASNNSSSQSALSMNAGPLVRVWFYFPSISTRSKRDDFIIHAPSYQLTGFLYAGKPGLLCVEGGSQAIDDYMKWIKTESWGDIPAHHKKVSERYRETKEVERVFEDMTEITDMVGERRGQRANRGDMKAMEDWLTERGLGEAFAKVLM
jgi:hypothetical protein